MQTSAKPSVAALVGVVVFSATSAYAAPRERRFDLSLAVTPLYSSDTEHGGTSVGGVDGALHVATRAGFTYLPARSAFTIGVAARHAWSDDHPSQTVALMGLLGLTVFRDRRVDATFSTAVGPSIQRLSYLDDFGTGFTWEALRAETSWWAWPSSALRWHLAWTLDRHGHYWSGRSGSVVSSAILVGFGIATRI